MSENRSCRQIGRFAIISLALVAPVALAAEPATSSELCRQKVAGYVFPDKVRDSAVAPARDMTQADKDTLNRVLLSQCLLNAGELAAHWDGKTEAERLSFFTNYGRIRGVVTESIYNEVFPRRQAAYTWESFLKSAVAFPALCGEENESEDTCRREFATMFAHWLQETSGLVYLSEGSCDQGGCSNYVDNPPSYFVTRQGSQPGAQPQYQYYGRGPKQLSYNYNYGRFSWIYLGSMEFLERPSELIADAWIDQSFISAFWFYMTPVSQKPSMHEVVTGLWQPNAVDQAVGIVPGFGATIDIINGALECGQGVRTATAANRIAFYEGGAAQGQQTAGTLAAFGLMPLPGEVVGCENFGPFPLGGAATHPLYFNPNSGMCELYPNEEVFTIYDQTPFRALGTEVCANGLDCCRKASQKWGGSIPMVLDDFVIGLGGTPIDIKANGSDAPVIVRAGVPLDFALSFEAGSHIGEEADWWLAAQDGAGRWYRYDLATQSWVFLPRGVPSASYQGPLSTLSGVGIAMSGLPAGGYTFYFGVDTLPNGTLDTAGLSYDSVQVQVTP